jgi:hypothetical protein
MAASSSKRLSWAERLERDKKLFADRQAQFEPQRETAWISAWARVLRMYILVSEHPDFARESGWWCDQLEVNAERETFQLDGMEGEAAKDTFTFKQHEQALNALSIGESLVKDFLIEKERRRQLELERRRLREQGLAKLSEEERRALGLSGDFDR